MTTFFLVRHGVTSHTGHKLTGRIPGVHLTEEGRAQADAAADALERVPLKAIYSSPIDRAMETAQPIAERHKLTIRKARGLGEVEFGKWSNRSFKTLNKKKLWATVQRFPSGARFPDGESFPEVQARAVGEMERLRRVHPRQAICCVSHADVIKLVAAHYLGTHLDLFQRLVVSPASITVISVGDGGPMVHALNLSPRALAPKP